MELMQNGDRPEAAGSLRCSKVLGVGIRHARRTARGGVSTLGVRRGPMADIKTVGVIGAGQMGTGIAHVCALAGYDVELNDVSRARIDAGVSMIEHNLARQV